MRDRGGWIAGRRDALFNRVVPEHLRWNCIREAGSKANGSDCRAIEYAGLRSFKPVHPHDVAKLIKCLDQYDFGKETPVERKFRKLLMEQDNKPRDQL